MGAASEHVSIVVTADNVALTELGFGTAGILGYNPTWSERARTYTDLDSVADDFATTKVEYRQAQTLFSQTPKPEQVMIIRGALPPTQSYLLSKLVAPAAGYRYLVTLDGEGVTETQIDLTLLADLAIPYIDSGAAALTVDVVAVAKTFTRTTGSWLTDGFVAGMQVTFSGFTNGGNNTLQTIVTVTDLVITTASASGLVNESGNGNERGAGPKVDSAVDDAFYSVAHGMTTGDGPYRLTTTGGVPGNTAVDTDYWVIVLTADTFQLATSRALALAGTEVNMSSSGTGTHTLQRDANDVLMAQLKQAINDVVGKNFTASQNAVAGDADTLSIVADTAGAWFSVSLDDVVTRGQLIAAQNHADPGIATDLANIANENRDWRTLITSFNSKAMIKAAAAWVEATEQTDYIPDSADSSIIQAATTGSADVADDMKTLAYTRSLGLYHNSPAKFVAAGAAGAFLTSKPGEGTVKYHQVAGVGGVKFTPTHKVNARAKNWGSLEAIAGATFLWEGKVPSGTFWDVQRDDDWVKNNMQLRILLILIELRKIPFTDPGIRMVGNEVDAALVEAVNAGVYSDFIVTLPKKSDIPTIKITNRVLPNVKWKAVRSGAVHNVEVAGNVVNGLVLV